MQHAKIFFPHEELEFACKNGEAEIDVLSFTKKKKCRNNSKHLTRKCDQAWNESHETTTTKASFHRKICKHLNIESDVIVEDDFKHKRNEVNLSKTSIDSPECSKDKFAPSKNAHASENYAKRSKY